MVVYLARPHTLTRFNWDDMKIFMAGNTIFPQYIASEITNATVLGRGRPVAERGGTTQLSASISRISWNHSTMLMQTRNAYYPTSAISCWTAEHSPLCAEIIKVTLTGMIT